MDAAALDLEKIARTVKSARMDKGLTQNELAIIAGLSLRSIQRVEAGEGVPRKYTLEVLAEKLDLKYEAFLSEPSIQNVEIYAANPALVHHAVNNSQKVIITITTALVIILFAIAFVFQSKTFPETSFELSVFIGSLVLFYGIILFWIWK